MPLSDTFGMDRAFVVSYSGYADRLGPMRRELSRVGIDGDTEIVYTFDNPFDDAVNGRVSRCPVWTEQCTTKGIRNDSVVLPCFCGLLLVVPCDVLVNWPVSFDVSALFVASFLCHIPFDLRHFLVKDKTSSVPFPFRCP